MKFELYASSTLVIVCVHISVCSLVVVVVVVYGVVDKKYLCVVPLYEVDNEENRCVWKSIVACFPIFSRFSFSAADLLYFFLIMHSSSLVPSPFLFLIFFLFSQQLRREKLYDGMKQTGKNGGEKMQKIESVSWFEKTSSS